MDKVDTVDRRGMTEELMPYYRFYLLDGFYALYANGDIGAPTLYVFSPGSCPSDEFA